MCGHEQITWVDVAAGLAAIVGLGVAAMAIIAVVMETL
jgi:hypothetical protein